MTPIFEIRSNELRKELYALQEEKTHLLSEIKSGARDSRARLEAMIRYSCVNEGVRSLSYQLREIGAAF